jgi:hypothetical protein
MLVESMTTAPSSSSTFILSPILRVPASWAFVRNLWTVSTTSFSWERKGE